MRPTIHVDDAIAAACMIVFHVDSHGFWTLDDLHYGSLREQRVQRKERHLNAEATRRLCDRFRIVVDARSASSSATRRSTSTATSSLPLLTFCCERRDLAVRWIDDHRSPL